MDARHTPVTIYCGQFVAVGAGDQSHEERDHRKHDGKGKSGETRNTTNEDLPESYAKQKKNI